MKKRSAKKAKLKRNQKRKKIKNKLLNENGIMNLNDYFDPIDFKSEFKE